MPHRRRAHRRWRGRNPALRWDLQKLALRARGGRDAWTNAVTACRRCNTQKGGRSPDQAGMPLLYVPYVPNRHEHFILRNRRILADQMEYLLAGVPKTSRLHVREGRAPARA